MHCLEIYSDDETITNDNDNGRERNNVGRSATPLYYILRISNPLAIA